MKRERLVLVVAGSDPSGGAGLELDLKVLARLGVHGAAIASCRTLQSATGVRDVEPAPMRPASRQLALLRCDARFGAIKIGMLPDAGWVALVAKELARFESIPSVYDPVVQPTIGRGVLSKAALRVVRRELLPRVTLATPNALEAAALLDSSLEEVRRDPDAAARALLAFGSRAVLLKGGHLRREGRVVDRLRGRGLDEDFEQPREPGTAPRGTGCALSSAIAANLAHGLPLPRSILRAQEWLRRARRAAVSMGRGRRYLGLVDARPV